MDFLADILQELIVVAPSKSLSSSPSISYGSSSFLPSIPSENSSPSSLLLGPPIQLIVLSRSTLSTLPNTLIMDIFFPRECAETPPTPSRLPHTHFQNSPRHCRHHHLLSRRLRHHLLRRQGVTAGQCRAWRWRKAVLHQYWACSSFRSRLR